MGVISDERRMVFVHIPKNGGNAVSQWLMTHVKNLVVVMEVRNDLSGQIDKHAPAGVYIEWMMRTDRDPSSYDWFAVIRNPMDRPMSVFTEIHRNQEWAIKVAGSEWWDCFSRLRDADEFVLSGMYDPNGPLNITHRQGWFLDPVVSHLLPFERFSELLPEALGLPGPIPVVHRGRYVRQLLSSAAQAVVREKYDQDFHLHEEVSMMASDLGCRP